MRLPVLALKFTSASASTAPAPSLPSACGATRKAFKSFVNRPLYPPNVTSTRAARRSTTTTLSPSDEMVEADAVNATLHVCVARSSTDVSGTPADESPPPVMYHRPCTTAPACPARFACNNRVVSEIGQVLVQGGLDGQDQSGRLRFNRFNTLPRDSANDPHASPPRGFPLARLDRTLHCPETRHERCEGFQRRPLWAGQTPSKSLCVCVRERGGSTRRKRRTGTVPLQRGTAHVMVARSSTNRSLKHLVADPPPKTYSSRSWCAVAMWSDRPHGASPYVSGCGHSR